MTQDNGLPRDPRIHYRFRREEFDFMFQWMTGAQTNGGVEVGELLYATSRIKEGDEESWIREWLAMGSRVEARARRSLAGGHKVSARESYLRAYAYHRAPLVFISPLREPERYRSLYRQAHEYFRMAAPLFDPPIEQITVPFEGYPLPGYFMPARAGALRGKTLIMVGGGDTFVEDLYGYIGPAAQKRGYNLLFVDLPGQGDLPFDGLTWPVEAEEPFTAVVDWALSRPEVDPERLVSYGLSGGGYLVPRAVSVEKRIRAVAACCILLDMSAVWNRRAVELSRRAERSVVGRLVYNMARRQRSAYFTMVDTYVWRWGVKEVHELVEASRGMITDATKITCPALNLVSEQEYTLSAAIRSSADEALQRIDNPCKQMVLAPREEGADSHGVGTNLSLMSQIVFDWFDEVLEI